MQTVLEASRDPGAARSTRVDGLALVFFLLCRSGVEWTAFKLLGSLSSPWVPLGPISLCPAPPSPLLTLLLWRLGLDPHGGSAGFPAASAVASEHLLLPSPSPLLSLSVQGGGHP